VHAKVWQSDNIEQWSPATYTLELRMALIMDMIFNEHVVNYLVQYKVLWSRRINLLTSLL
jgi:hypothetical protein